MPKCKILVVDDHPIVRKGLAQLISQEPDLELCGDAESVAQALDQIAACQPDLVVVDMALKDSHGMELLAEIRAGFPHVRTLVWSMFDEKVYAERAIRAGAMGYVNKQESTQQLMDAIRLVLKGEFYVSSRMTRALLRRISGSSLLGQDPIQTLSNRELEVFEMIGNALTTQQIARKLSLSPKTVEAHRERIKAKLNLANAAELSRRAIQWVLEGG